MKLDDKIYKSIIDCLNSELGHNEYQENDSLLVMLGIQRAFVQLAKGSPFYSESMSMYLYLEDEYSRIL